MKKVLGKLTPLVSKSIISFVKNHVAPAVMGKGVDILTTAFTRAVFVELDASQYQNILRFWVRENPSKVKALPTINFEDWITAADEPNLRPRLIGVQKIQDAAESIYVQPDPPRMKEEVVTPLVAFNVNASKFSSATGLESVKLLHISKSVWVVLYFLKEDTNGGKDYNIKVKLKFLRKDLLCVRDWLEETSKDFARDLKKQEEVRKAARGNRRIEIVSPESLDRILRDVGNSIQYAPAIDSLCHTNDTGKAIKHHLEKFYSQTDTYQKFARKHKKGVLLYGPPGTGKTTIIKALAGYFGATILYVSLGTMTEEAFAKFIDNVSGRNSLFIVFEDVDAIFEKRVALSGIKNGVRFETFLNFLDGMLAPDNAVIFLTANFPEKLDAALVRDGRIDLKVAIQPWTSKEVAEYIGKLDPKTFDGVDLVAILGNGLFIPSSVERFCGDYLENVGDVIPNLHKLIERNKATKNCDFVFN